MSKKLFENRAVREGILLYARADKLITRIHFAVRNAATGFLDHALTNEEKSELGVILYDYSLRRWDSHRGGSGC